MNVMASVGKWEIVGKQKKGKTGPPSLTKAQKKTMLERMPRLEKTDPVKEDSTIYDVFKANEKRSTPSANAAGDNTKQRTTPAPAKKKKPEQNGKGALGKQLTLEAALAQIEHAELESVVNQSQLRFPENQDVWLKDLASFFNIKMDKVVDSDTVFKDKNKEFPQNQLSSACRQTVNGVFKKCSKQNLDHLFYHCMQSMINEFNKGLSTFGYKVFLQMLAFYKPTVVLSKIPQYLELIKTNVNRPSLCLSILWAIGQCGIVDLRSGIRVWMDLMLPCLGIRSVAAYPVEYVENLFVWHKQTQAAFGEIGLREYFQVLDSIFSPRVNLPGDLRKRLQCVHPEIKTIAFGANPSTNLRNFFASYLRRAEPDSAEAIKQEVLLCLVLCLGTDKHCWSTWCQMYTKHLPQSGVLLLHLTENWELLSKQERHMLRETLRSFAVTNDELISRGKASLDGFQLCNIATKELLQKMSQSRFPWGTLIFSVLTILSAVVVYDITFSPRIKEARTVQIMDHCGILTILEQAWGRITMFIYLAMSWSEEHFPRYYNWMVETAGPTLRQVCQAVVDSTAYLVKVASPHCLWAFGKTQQGLLWVYECWPELWDECQAWLQLSWGFVKDYTQWIWKHVLHWSLATHHWMCHHVLTSVPTGNFSANRLQETALWGVQQMQNYTLLFISWCNQILFK